MNSFYGKTRCCMADKTKRKSITSIDDLTEVIDFLEMYYRSIISNAVTKVNRYLRKVKVYPSLTLPPYQRKVKVYPSLPELPELEPVRIIDLPDYYVPTPFTEVRHVIHHERYNTFHSGVARWINSYAKRDPRYSELNNYEELFGAYGQSAITDLYEKYFDSGLDIMDMIIESTTEIAELTQQIVEKYRRDKAIVAAWKGM